MAVRRLESFILEQITDANGLAAARNVLTEVVGSLRTVALLVVVGGVVVALIAYLLGRPTWLGNLAERWRQTTAASPDGSDLERSISAHHDLLVIVGILVAVVTLFLWGIDLASVMVISGGLSLYLWAIARARDRPRRIRHAGPMSRLKLHPIGTIPGHARGAYDRMDGIDHVPKPRRRYQQVVA